MQYTQRKDNKTFLYIGGFIALMLIAVWLTSDPIDNLLGDLETEIYSLLEVNDYSYSGEISEQQALVKINRITNKLNKIESDLNDYEDDFTEEQLLRFLELLALLDF
ncbi:MAG: hypothetical protein ACRC4W_00295 [Treponemataceae bacterium]